ncbi:MAG: hypothetical protein NVSMB2_17810 [Chloroflexota bacterium]
MTMISIARAAGRTIEGRPERTPKKMAWLNDLGLRWKLLGGFGFMGVVLAIVGWQGLSSAQMLNAGLHVVTDTTLPSYKALSKTKDGTVRGQRDILYSIVEPDPQQRDTFLKSVETDIQIATDQFAAYKAFPVDDDAKPQVQQFETSFAAWTKALKDASSAAKNGAPDANAAATRIVIDQAKPRYSEMATALNNLMTHQESRVSETAAAKAADFDRTFKVLLAAVIGGVLVSMMVGMFLSSNISTPLEVVTDLANHAALGDTGYDVGEKKRRRLRRRDEVGAIAKAFDDLRVYVAEMAMAAETVADGDLSVRVEPRSDGDVLGNAFSRMVAGLADLVGLVRESANMLADTSAQLGATSNQTGAAVQQVTQAIQNVAAGASDTSRNAQETNVAVAHLSQAVDGIARGASDQAEQVQSASATATEMAEGVEQVAANAQNVAHASAQTRMAAEQGSQAVRATTAVMSEIHVVVTDAATKVRDLGNLGERIGAVVETIDDIAEQTNLLALNAAIEAARAGEHGKGFAVVADEVRKLAERSSRETKQIAELIRQVQGGTRDAVDAMQNGSAKVEQGSERAQQAGVALDEILSAVEATARQVAEIATSSQAMAAGARTVTDAMHSISAVVEENTAATEEMAAQAGQVTAAIHGIAAVSEQQSAATEQVSASAEEMSAQIEEVGAQAQELAATAEQLKTLVARFKLAQEPVGFDTRVVPFLRAA